MVALKDCLGIKYKLDKSENFDEAMKALGIRESARKVGNTASLIVELTEDRGTYTLKYYTPSKDFDLVFKLGELFEEVTLDGRTVKSLITQEGDNKLVHIQMGEKESKIVREFTPEELKLVITVDDIVCTRIFKKVE